MTTIEAAGLIARCLVAVAFILAASMKSSAFSRWRLVVRDYRLIPEVLVFPAAAGVIVAELALGVALLVNPNAPAASLGAGVLLSVFTFALIAQLARGKAQSDCGCFGEVGSRTSTAIVRNVGLGALLVTANVLDGASSWAWPLSVRGDLDFFGGALLSTMTCLATLFVVVSWRWMRPIAA